MIFGRDVVLVNKYEKVLYEGRDQECSSGCLLCSLFCEERKGYCCDMVDNEMICC